MRSSIVPATRSVSTSSTATPESAANAAAAASPQASQAARPVRDTTRREPGSKRSGLVGAQRAMEERQHVVLESVGHLARVRARVDLERIGDPVAVECVVKLGRVDAETVLVANVDGDPAIAPQARGPLVDEGERRVG